MNRLSRLGVLGVVLLTSACGAAAAATNQPPAGRGGAGRGATAGQVVKLATGSLVLSTANGDVTVDYSSSTTFTKTSTGQFGDIASGSCVQISATKDGSGALTATSVRLFPAVAGKCASGAAPGPAGGTARAFPTGAPRPSANPNAARVSGTVQSVSGTTVTVVPLTGSTTPVSVTVPTTVTVTETASITASDIAVEDCVLATGAKDSSGAVAARSITDVPAGPSGCLTGRGAGGGFGGGGFGGGGFGGGGFGGGGFGGGGNGNGAAAPGGA